jgi:dCMP deaminase
MEIVEFIKSSNIRPSWDQYFMMVAYMISKRSSCKKINVGCVVVDNNKNIITTGYNGHVAGGEHRSIERNGHEQMTIHSETNAIAIAGKKGASVYGATAYVTHYPCINCAKILIASGIKKIIYDCEYKPDELCKELYADAGVIVEKFNW